jgi:hypothetical protein
LRIKLKIYCSTLKKTVSELEDNIADAASVKEEMIVNRESQDVLQKRKQAQDAYKELVPPNAS